jgi:hypothetical protein
MILAAECIPSPLRLMLGRHSGIGNRSPDSRFFAGNRGGNPRFPIRPGNSLRESPIPDSAGNGNRGPDLAGRGFPQPAWSGPSPPARLAGTCPSGKAQWMWSRPGPLGWDRVTGTRNWELGGPKRESDSCQWFLVPAGVPEFGYSPYYPGTSPVPPPGPPGQCPVPHWHTSDKHSARPVHWWQARGSPAAGAPQAGPNPGRGMPWQWRPLGTSIAAGSAHGGRARCHGPGRGSQWEARHTPAIGPAGASGWGPQLTPSCPMKVTTVDLRDAAPRLVAECEAPRSNRVASVRSQWPLQGPPV